MKSNKKESNILFDIISNYKFDRFCVERKFVHSGNYICTFYDIRIGLITTKIKEEGLTIEECVEKCFRSIKEEEKKSL